MQRKSLLIFLMTFILVTGCSSGSAPTALEETIVTQPVPTVELAPTISPTETQLPQATPTSLPAEPTEDIALAAFEQGMIFYTEKQYEQAISEFSRAIEVNPIYIEALYRRGVSYLEMGDFEKGRTDIDQIFVLAPNSPFGFNGRGIINGYEGNFEAALEDFSQAILLNPEFAEAYHNRGITYGSQGNINDAIIDFTMAIELKPEDIVFYFSRALAYSSLGRNDEAIADFRKVLRESKDESLRSSAEEFIKALGGVP